LERKTPVRHSTDVRDALLGEAQAIPKLGEKGAAPGADQKERKKKGFMREKTRLRYCTQAHGTSQDDGRRGESAHADKKVMNGRRGLFLQRKKNCRKKT